MRRPSSGVIVAVSSVHCLIKPANPPDWAKCTFMPLPALGDPVKR
jgi:hypothetical protein